jgi:hypothetical protein
MDDTIVFLTDPDFYILISSAVPEFWFLLKMLYVHVSNI